MEQFEILKKYTDYFRETYYAKTGKREFLALCQAFFRAFDFGSDTSAILHASAAITSSGRGILFGDDGNITKGKTLLSLALASKSGCYVADEYVLYTRSDNKIFGNASIPINLKGETASFITEQYGISYKNDSMIFADDYYSIVDQCSVALMVVPYMNSSKTCVEIPSAAEKKKLMKTTHYGHRVKFLNPEYDHLSVLAPESEQKTDIQDGLKIYSDIEYPWPIIKIMIKDIEDVPGIVEELNNYI